MALKVELKPGEKIIIGESVITNDNQRTRLFVEGNAPILREKDILTLKTADTPAKRIYLAVQMMYLTRDTRKFQDDFFHLVNDLADAVPSSLPYITRIGNHIIANALYKALKEARGLIDYEQQLLDLAKTTEDDGAATEPAPVADER